MKKLPLSLAVLLAVAIAAACAQTPTGAPIAKATDTFWLYKAGKFKGPGDYSYGSGKITYGPSTVIVTGDEAWQPRFPHDDINTGPYTYLTVSIKPTQQQTWISGMLMIGDVAIPGSNGAVDIMPYGPNPAVIGEWNVYRIPLTAYGIKLGSGLHVYKVMFQSQNIASPQTNKVEYDAVGLVPE